MFNIRWSTPLTSCWCWYAPLHHAPPDISRGLYRIHVSGHLSRLLVEHLENRLARWKL